MLFRHIAQLQGISGMCVHDMLLAPAGMIAVALTPNLKIAAVATSYMVTLFHLFAGFVITQPNMPGWW